MPRKFSDIIFSNITLISVILICINLQEDGCLYLDDSLANTWCGLTASVYVNISV